MTTCNNCGAFGAIVLAPSSLRIEPVGRWFEANLQRRQHGLSSHHSSSSSSSSASSEVNLSSDEEDPNFLLTLDPSEWKVEFMCSITLLLCTSQFQNHPIPPPPRAHPSHLNAVLPIQWGIWPKMRPAQTVTWPLSCQNGGQRRKQKDFVILTAFSMSTVFTALCSYIRYFVGALRTFEKVCNCGLSGMTNFIVNEQTSIRQLFETARYFGCV